MDQIEFIVDSANHFRTKKRLLSQLCKHPLPQKWFCSFSKAKLTSCSISKFSCAASAEMENSVARIVNGFRTNNLSATIAKRIEGISEKIIAHVHFFSNKLTRMWFIIDLWICFMHVTCFYVGLWQYNIFFFRFISFCFSFCIYRRRASFIR